MFGDQIYKPENQEFPTYPGWLLYKDMQDAILWLKRDFIKYNNTHGDKGLI